MSETKKAVIVQPDGTAEVIEFTNETGLKTLQTAVDGYIEAVFLDDTTTMWVNEEGLFRPDLVSNFVGAKFYLQMFGVPNPINGTIVFTGGSDSEGNTESLDEDKIVDVLEIAALAKEYITKTTK
jgi:hypothetical protein